MTSHKIKTLYIRYIVFIKILFMLFQVFYVGDFSSSWLFRWAMKMSVFLYDYLISIFQPPLLHGVT